MNALLPGLSLLAIASLGLLGCPRPAATLVFQNNAKLTSGGDDVEPSSAVIPAGACASLTDDRYFLSYGQYGGKFLSGQLSCFGAPSAACLVQENLSPFIPSTPTVTNGGTLDAAGGCVGGTVEPLYQLGYTDSETVRVGPKKVVHVRLGRAKQAVPGTCNFEAGRQMILSRHSSDCGASWKDKQFFALDRQIPRYAKMGFGKLDQPWLYYDPFSARSGAPLHMLLYVGNPSSDTLVNRTEWFTSSDDGETWSQGDPAFAATVPFARTVMTSTADGTLFFLACDGVATETSPTAKAHPVLFWKHGMKGTLKKRDLFDLTGVSCGQLTSAAWPSNVESGTLPLVISRVDGATAKVQRIRIGYPYIKNEGSSSKPRWVQALTIRTITLHPDAATGTDLVDAVETGPFPTRPGASILQAQFLQSDMIDNPSDGDTSILWWIEADLTGVPRPFTAKYAIVEQGGLWQPEAPLAVQGGAASPVPLFWAYPTKTPSAKAFVGDYSRGGYFSRDGKMHFVMQWSQGVDSKDPPETNLTLHGESVVLTP